MFRMKGLACLLLTASIAMLLIAARPSAVNAQTPIYVYLEKSSYDFSPDDPVGTLFNVTVLINSTVPFNLMMWQVYLAYDETIINVTQNFVNDTYKGLRTWPHNNMTGRNWDADYVFYGQSGGTIGDPASLRWAGMTGVLVGDMLMADVLVDATTPKKLCTFELNITTDESAPLTCGLLLNTEQFYLYDFNGPITTVVASDGTYNYVPEPILAILLAAMASSIGITAVAKVKARRKKE